MRGINGYKLSAQRFLGGQALLMIIISNACPSKRSEKLVPILPRVSEMSAWSFACLARFASRTKEKERPLVV